MADNPKFKTARMKAEQKIYELMDDLEGCKDGYNSGVYKAYFASLSDNEFKKFMDRLANVSGCELNALANSIAIYINKFNY